MDLVKLICDAVANTTCSGGNPVTSIVTAGATQICEAVLKAAFEEAKDDSSSKDCSSSRKDYDYNDCHRNPWPER